MCFSHVNFSEWLWLEFSFLKIHIVIPSMYGKNICLSTTDIVSSNLDQGEVYNNMW